MVKFTKKGKLVTAGLGALLVFATSAPSAYAALTDTTNFSQSITSGSLSTFVADDNGEEVGSPSVNFSAATVSNDTQTSTGTFGTNTERIYIDNPGAITGDNGWTVTFAATGGPTAAWTSGGNSYAFNGNTASDGQLTVNPAVGSITAEVGGTDGITLGSPATFSGGTNAPITLVNASASADDINRVYIQGIGLSQTIPAGTAAGVYVLDFTQTLTQV